MQLINSDYTKEKVVDKYITNIKNERVLLQLLETLKA